MDTAPLPTVPAASTPRRGRTIALAIGATLAGAGIATGIVFGLTAGTAAAAPTTPATIIVDGGGQAPAHVVTPIKPVVPVTPITPVGPSAAISTLQSELGQLNYYEGPVTGVMNTQTTQAITYLQRDAHLPQTGTMNAATQAALANFLAHGNNQMGS
ncbi:peptidoglycan-binding domain-containing protein [Pseudonocardia sp. GCM10023141]|uniref:peptidoglycan-binding domain-containing protein n=1 Tax=Pseudonocardia sp. GCM10023141 TaxID=3252653 RepID=UPI00361EE3BB